ncbi:hypothetical protein [Bacillus cereus]|uniref:Uncharacterized protein n=1 Tax=Bacillus cereus TaxID=1396 RepID=A0A9X6YR88_BACCE|nr:hypothetical protein [Bacillus cereus]PEQ83391.1 hypothetical protein CN475_22890 [Bacillus cereus]
MPIYYTEEEYRKILERTNKEQKVFMPNEIFDDLIKAIDVKEEGHSSKHIAYAFSYIYLITYLYRYAKISNEHDFSEEGLKRLLTVSPTSKGKKGVNYITKRGGLLEELGYIYKVTDFPLAYFFDEEEKSIEFEYFSQVVEDGVPSQFVTNLKNKKINYPVKLLKTRIVKTSNGKEELDPILDDVYYTTRIDLDIFIYCMSRKELGVESFYLYSFIKFMNDIYGVCWNCPLVDLPKKVGMQLDVIKSKLKSMEQYGMLHNTHEDFIIGAPQGSESTKKANGYTVKRYGSFIKKEQQKRSYKRGKIKTYEENEKIKNAVLEGCKFLTS